MVFIWLLRLLPLGVSNNRKLSDMCRAIIKVSLRIAINKLLIVVIIFSLILLVHLLFLLTTHALLLGVYVKTLTDLVRTLTGFDYILLFWFWVNDTLPWLIFSPNHLLLLNNIIKILDKHQHRTYLTEKWWKLILHCNTGYCNIGSISQLETRGHFLGFDAVLPY